MEGKRGFELTKSLCKEYKGFFKIGAAVDAEDIFRYQGILQQHFNSITSENDMKFEKIHPERGRFAWDASDKLVEYATRSGKYMRGHTLLWHEQMPGWICDENTDILTREDTLKVMEEHISEIVSRYKGRVNCWDVVNEVIDNDDGFLRKTRWFDIIGEDYIDKAFHYAREADPKAQLFLNEFNGNQQEKQERICTLVERLKKKRVPIHGIGIQGHYSIAYPKMEEVRAEIERYARLGLQIHITELDVSLFEYSDRRPHLGVDVFERQKRQEEMYYRLFEVYRQYSDVVTNVTLWGVADDDTWLDDFPVKGRKDAPLLFDVDLKPKAALYAVMEFGGEQYGTAS
ncbi:MAG: endo-1,4-beta-xylanase [Lachnospiraceae bacterium]|nr:endo-1,4-beta-xylanase [Lachnospiraceae bacterium]